MKRIAKMLVAALMAVIAPVCALAEEAADMNIIEKFFESGMITVLGMCGIFAVMIVIYIVITVLNKTTK